MRLIGQEDEQVDQILSWLENDLPAICQKITEGGAKEEAEAPIETQQPAAPVEKKAPVPRAPARPRKEESRDEDIAEIYKEQNKHSKQNQKEKVRIRYF